MVLYCVVEKRHYLTGMELQYWHPCPRVGHWWPTYVGFYKSRQRRLGIQYGVRPVRPEGSLRIFSSLIEGVKWLQKGIVIILINIYTDSNQNVSRLISRSLELGTWALQGVTIL